MPGIYVSFDDTDSLDGMCTTYLATLLIEDLSEFDVIGFPRLVRLNPNVPWKTRGNAAICLAFGEGQGKRFLVGGIGDEKIFAYSRGRPCDAVLLFERAHKIIERNAHFACDNTNPGLVVSRNRPPFSLYLSTVREIVDLESVLEILSKEGALVGKFKNGRGVIGAAAAMAWRPRDRTFEVLAYRDPSLIGTKRRIDLESVRKMDERFKSTFHNIDKTTGHLAIAPGSPCPILFGIRGDNPWDLIRAKDMIISEPISRWLLFLTNQATDEHIAKRKASEVLPMQGIRITGKVLSAPREIIGGHVFFDITDGSGTITCAVYEPSGDMRSAARQLKAGDEVEIFGSVREEPFQINVEKMRVVGLSPIGEKIENPVCPKCGKHMKSVGAQAGYRCRKCGTRAPAGSEKRAERTAPRPGWYEPPIASRRHLYKPVSRIGKKRIALREILNTYPFD